MGLAMTQHQRCHFFHSFHICKNQTKKCANIKEKFKFVSYVYVSKTQDLNLLSKKYLPKRSIIGSRVLEEGYVTVDEGKFQPSYETLACAHRWDRLFASVDSTPSAFPCLINIWLNLERMLSCDYTHWQTPTGLRCGYKTCRRPQRPLQAWWLSTGSMVTSSLGLQGAELRL